MDIKRIISIVVATLMLAQTTVFANATIFSSLNEFLDQDYVDKMLAISSNDKSHVKTNVSNETDEFIETISEGSSIRLTVDMGETFVNQPTTYTFEENVYLHYFKFYIDKKSDVRFDVFFEPIATNDKVSILFDGLLVNGRKFELSKGWHELSVRRSSNDLSSKFEYDLEIIQEKIYDRNQKNTSNNGADITTGIYNESFDDIVTVIAGEEFKIQRRYSSNEVADSCLGRGWTINYDCKAQYGVNVDYEKVEDNEIITKYLPNTNEIILQVPDGNIYSFKKILVSTDEFTDGEEKYLPLDSCSSFMEFPSYYRLNTPDNTSYYYNIIGEKNGGCLFKIVDTYGNVTNINWKSNKVDNIVDYVGNTYSFNYSDNKLENIVFNQPNFDESFATDDVIFVDYEHDGEVLKSSTSSSGKKYIYNYNNKKLLTSIKDPSTNYIYSQIWYQLYYGNYCVKEHNDKYGATHTYVFDLDNKTTTVKSLDGAGSSREEKYYYDDEKKVFRKTQKFGETTLETSIEYFVQEFPYVQGNPEDPLSAKHLWHFWKNGQIKKITNFDGTTIEYSFLESDNASIEDLREYHGLPLEKIVTTTQGQILEHEEYTYGHRTFLVEKKVWLSNDDYRTIKYNYSNKDEDGNALGGMHLYSIEEYPSKYSYENQKPQLITQYTYDTNSTIKGQPITVSYSNSSGSDTDVWTYTYDKGNLTEIVHPENATDSAKELYTYNDFGLVTRHVSAGGTETLYEYNKGLQETKKTVVADSNDRTKDEVTRTVYDEYGHPIQIISPNQYNQANESENGQYNNDQVGVRNEYYGNGLLKKTTDPKGNTFEYTYDCYGNKISEKMPNGSIYKYTYDELSNQTSKRFKETETSDEVLLETNSYSYGDGYTTCVNTKADDSGVVFSMEYKFDHNNNLKTSRMLFEENEEPVAKHVRDIRYDMAGNVVCDFSRKNEFEWNAVYYTYNNYDSEDNVLFDEKFTLLEPLPSVPESTEKPNGTYKYERTNYDKNGNISGLIVGKVNNGEFVGDNIVVETHEYYADNLLKSTTDANGVVTTYEYDNDRNLSKVTIIESTEKQQVVSYKNNHAGKPEEIRTYVDNLSLYDNRIRKDDLGYYVCTTNDYDKNGNLIKQESSTGLTTEYEYNLNNLQTSVTSYEKGNRDVTVITESVDYDFAGNVILQTDKNRNTTKFVYNEQGFLIYTIYPNGGIKLTTRDTQGRIVYEVEPVDYMGTETETETNATLETYKADLEKISEMSHTHYTYVPFEKHDLVVTATKYIYDPESKTSTSYVKQIDKYDYFGNLVSTTDANGNTFRYEYDVVGNCVKYIEPETENEFTTFYEYDMLGRKIKEGNYYGDYYAYTYDKKGNILSASIVEDGVSKIISTYTYDKSGNLLTQTDGNGNTTSLLYDDSNRLIKQTSGNINNSIADYYAYDGVGNLVIHTDRNGNCKTYEYDVFNRLVNTTVGNDNETDEVVVAEYTYDGNGNILAMTDSTGTTTYTYDSMGRILTKNHTEPETETVTETKKVSYVYDIHENVPYGYVAEKTTEPDGDTVEKWYDSDDKIVKVIDGTFVTEYNYYADGRLKSTKKPDGSVTTNTYDDEGNLLTLVTLDAAGDVLDSFTYVYDDNAIGYKNQISKTEIVAGVNKGTTSYEYDIKGQLTKVTNPDGSTNEYTYDNAGNRLSKTTTNGETSVVTNYTYDEQNRLTRAVTGNSTTYYGYDNNGNQISEWTRIADNPVVNYGVKLSELNEETDDLMTLYEYDTFDRLIKIEQGEDVIENAYTADGKKLSRTTNGKITYYVYDGNVVIEERNSENEESARNVYGRNIITRENALNKIIYGFNGHGDVIYQANTVGAVLVAYNYDEFGNIIDNVSINARAPGLIENPDYIEGFAPIDNPYRYAGYEYIEEIGIYDLNARYYNPEIARFLSQDPYYNLGNRVIGLYEINVPTATSIMQANNIYAYCGNAPIVRIEIGGQFFDIVFDVISLGFSIADVVMNPTDVLAWAGLAGDALDLIPGITGLGEIIKATNGTKKLVSVGSNADEVVDTLKVLNRAERTKEIKDGAVVLSYKNLKKLSKDTGLEAHHLIEKRFASTFGITNTDDILSIAIDKDTHQLITSKMRNKIGYKNDLSKTLRTDTVDARDVWNAVVDTYTELGMEEYLPELKKQLLDIGDKDKLNVITDWMVD